MRTAFVDKGISLLVPFLVNGKDREPNTHFTVTAGDEVIAVVIRDTDSFEESAKDGVVIEICGDKPCPDYRTTDAGLVRDTLIDRGLSIASVRRSFNTIKAIFNLAIVERC